MACTVSPAWASGMGAWEGQGGFQEDHGVSLAAPEVFFGLAGLGDRRLDTWLAPPVSYRVAMDAGGAGGGGEGGAGREKDDDFLLSWG